MCTFSLSTWAQDLTKFIIMNLPQDKAIKLQLAGFDEGDQVRVVSGLTDTIFTIPSAIPEEFTIQSQADTMIVYGNIYSFGCDGDNQIISIDLTNAPNVQSLNLMNNLLTELDVSNNHDLTNLDITNNQISSLNIENNTGIGFLTLNENPIESIDLSHLANLYGLFCSNTNISSLDLSNCATMYALNCNNNKNLTSLDLSNCTSLMAANIRGNNFTTESYDQLMCSLPTPQFDVSIFIPLYNSEDSLAEVFSHTNMQNATSKGWNVVYYTSYAEGSSETITTDGTYVCGTAGLNEETNSNEQVIAYPNPTTDNVYVNYAEGSSETITTDGTYVCGTAGLNEETNSNEQVIAYPNPTTDNVYVNANNEIVKIFDVNGKLVKTEIIKNSISLQGLPNGIYYINIKNKVFKYKKIK